MRGTGHSDPIETVAFKHEEGNEGEKIGVKRGILAFYGGKLLKRQGRASVPRCGDTSWVGPSLRRRRFSPNVLRLVVIYTQEVQFGPHIMLAYGTQPLEA
jgi:hypothetical protein